MWQLGVAAGCVADAWGVAAGCVAEQHSGLEDGSIGGAIRQQVPLHRCFHTAFSCSSVVILPSLTLGVVRCCTHRHKRKQSEVQQQLDKSQKAISQAAREKAITARQLNFVKRGAAMIKMKDCRTMSTAGLVCRVISNWQNRIQAAKHGKAALMNQVSSQAPTHPLTERCHRG